MSYEEALEVFVAKINAPKKKCLVITRQFSFEVQQGFVRLLDDIIQKQIPYEQGVKQLSAYLAATVSSIGKKAVAVKLSPSIVTAAKKERRRK